MKATREQNIEKRNINKRFCPLLSKPFDDCYCVKLSSQDIERAIHFCTKYFKRCEVYKTLIAGDPALHINF